jgi:hypothetical protein
MGRAVLAEREMAWFPSKVDWWIGVLLAIAPVVMVASFAITIVAGTGTLVVSAALLLLVAIYAGLVFPMRYGIGGGELVIRHGVMRQRCTLEEVVEVRPTRNPLSSPALSLDRLMIKKGEGFRNSIMISPADKQGFLDLLEREAGLERQGDTLVRPAAKR